MKLSEQSASATADRRSFLKLTAAGTVTAGGTFVAAKAEAAQTAGQSQDGLYRETEHVKRYYDLARF
jgi:hypothetical protein